MANIRENFKHDFDKSRCRVSRWCGYHHECLDGSGYPFHVEADGICLQSRILAVADRFVALTENRPYRDGIPIREVTRILGELAGDAKLDSHVVALATRDSDDIYESMEAAHQAELKDYEAFLESSTFTAFE
jgi:HD-GYP domain-containing protein (c-di-GMP phosphodiesterase class II)